VPELVIDTSKDLTPPIATDTMDTDAVDTDALDDGAVATDAMNDATDIDVDDDSSSIAADAAYLSEGSTAIFPCTIRYMDLTFLELKHLIRVPHLMLIRDEWRTVVHIFNKRKRGIRGSAVFTGQPGTGEHRYCY
jgi:hypothetical protein